MIRKIRQVGPHHIVEFQRIQLIEQLFKNKSFFRFQFNFKLARFPGRNIVVRLVEYIHIKRCLFDRNHPPYFHYGEKNRCYTKSIKKPQKFDEGTFEVNTSFYFPKNADNIQTCFSRLWNVAFNISSVRSSP